MPDDAPITATERRPAPSGVHLRSGTWLVARTGADGRGAGSEGKARSAPPRKGKVPTKPICRRSNRNAARGAFRSVQAGGGDPRDRSPAPDSGGAPVRAARPPREPDRKVRGRVCRSESNRGANGFRSKSRGLSTIESLILDQGVGSLDTPCRPPTVSENRLPLGCRQQGSNPVSLPATLIRISLKKGP